MGYNTGGNEIDTEGDDYPSTSIFSQLFVLSPATQLRLDEITKLFVGAGGYNVYVAVIHDSFTLHSMSGQSSDVNSLFIHQQQPPPLLQM